MSVFQTTTFAVGFFVIGVGIACAAENQCGTSTEVKAGDTLSSISDRCGVSESRLLASNPTIEGSSDLRVGGQVKIESSASSVTSRINSGADRVIDSLTNFAGWIGSTTDDLLEKNPDIKRRIDGLKDQAKAVSGTSGTVNAKREPGPGGDSVVISANGLPTNSAAVIGAGAPGQAYNVLSQVTTTADGTVNTRVRIPDSISFQKSLIFVVADVNGRWVSRSPRVDMVAKSQ